MANQAENADKKFKVKSVYKTIGIKLRNEKMAQFENYSYITSDGGEVDELKKSPFVTGVEDYVAPVKAVEPEKAEIKKVK